MSTTGIAELIRSSKGRRALAAKSPVFFDSYYCGMRWAAHREKWLNTALGARQKAKKTKRKAKMLVLAPRDHGKTEAAISLAVYLICHDRNIRILWISESAEQAKKRVKRVQALLKTERIVADFCSVEMGGPWQQSEDDNWTKSMLYVARDKISVDPTLEAVGSGGAVTGGHFDVILCDDLEDDRTVFSELNRSKTRNWWGGTVQPMLVRGGLMFVIGTRKHFDDLYQHLTQDATFGLMKDEAIIDWPDEFEYVMGHDEQGREFIDHVAIKGKPRVLWPEERPIEYLLEERYSIGSQLFSREFQNQVQDDSVAAFKWAWLEAAMERGADMKLGQVPDVPGFEFVQGWDLALVTDAKKAETKDRDYTVGIGWGKDAAGNRYLVSGKRDRGMSPNKLRNTVVGEYEGIEPKPRAVVVERNAFGELHFLGLQKSTDLPLKAHYTGGGNIDMRSSQAAAKNKADPWQGVPSMAALFENGKVIFPTGDERSRQFSETVCKELWGYGREAHDDTVMALWIAETELRRASFVHQIGFSNDIHYEGVSDERAAQSYLLDDGNVTSLDEYRQRATEDSALAVWEGLGI